MHSPVKPPISAADRVPLRDKIVYGAAGITDLWGSYTINRLATPIFTIALGMSPTLVGVILVIFRVWDAITDPIAGWVSDNTRTRWGRRRPYLLFGAVGIAVLLPAVFFVGREWSEPGMVAWLVVSGMLLYLAHSFWNVPYQSLLLEMTPDTNERTNISAIRAYFQQGAGLMHGLLWFFVTLPIFANAAGELDTVYGARVVVAAMAISAALVGVLPAFLLKERYYAQACKQPQVSLWKNFRIALTNKPFLLLSGFTLLYIVGSQVAFNLFALHRYYYVTSGDEVLAASITAVEGIISTGFAVLGVPCAQWTANRFGKPAALLGGTILNIVGALMTWFFFTPAAPWISIVCNPLLAFAGAAIWVVIPSMTADIVDHDELRIGSRHEGAFASIFSWVVKLTFSLGVLIPGPLIEWGGFDVKLGADQAPATLQWMRISLAIVPTVILLPAIWLAVTYPLTRKRMESIREALEARRGVL